MLLEENCYSCNKDWESSAGAGLSSYRSNAGGRVCSRCLVVLQLAWLSASAAIQ